MTVHSDDFTPARPVIALLTPAEAEAIRRIRNRVSGGQTIRALAAEAAAESGIPLKALLGPSRRARICRVREIVYKAARDRGYSLSQIGRVFGRDHTTIMSGLRNLEKRDQA